MDDLCGNKHVTFDEGAPILGTGLSMYWTAAQGLIRPFNQTGYTYELLVELENVQDAPFRGYLVRSLQYQSLAPR